MQVAWRRAINTFVKEHCHSKGDSLLGLQPDAAEKSRGSSYGRRLSVGLQH